MDKKKRIEWLNNRISSMEQCRDEMPFGLSKDEEMELSAYKIALASLTADAVGSFHIYEQKVDATTDYVRDGEWPIDEGELLVYAAPQVPEIKLPNNLQDAFEEGNKIPLDTQRCGDSYCVSTFHNWKGEEFMHQFKGFLKGINYVKRLNGLGE